MISQHHCEVFESTVFQTSLDRNVASFDLVYPSQRILSDEEQKQIIVLSLYLKVDSSSVQLLSMPLTNQLVQSTDRGLNVMDVSLPGLPVLRKFGKSSLLGRKGEQS